MYESYKPSGSIQLRPGIKELAPKASLKDRILNPHSQIKTTRDPWGKGFGPGGRRPVVSLGASKGTRELANSWARSLEKRQPHPRTIDQLSTGAKRQTVHRASREGGRPIGEWKVPYSGIVPRRSSRTESGPSGGIPPGRPPERGNIGRRSAVGSLLRHIGRGTGSESNSVWGGRPSGFGRREKTVPPWEQRDVWGHGPGGLRGGPRSSLTPGQHSESRATHAPGVRPSREIKPSLKGSGPLIHNSGSSIESGVRPPGAKRPGS